MIQDMQDEQVASDQVSEVNPDDLSGDFEEDDEFLSNLAAPTHISLPKVVVIIIKTIIGAHIVLIPYTASQLGWVLFSIVLISIIGIHHFTTILLLRCKNWSRHSNFYTIMYHCWPYVGSKLFGTLLMALNNLAFCVLQFMFIKISIVNMKAQLSQRQFIDFFQNTEEFLYYRGWFIVGVMALLQLPFIFRRKIESLKIFSMLGVFGIVVFILTFIIYFFVKDHEQGFDPFPDPQFDYKYPVASISILILTLNFHMNFFPIYKGLKKPTDERMEMASLYGLIATAVIYFIVGLLGFAMFGRLTFTNVLFKVTKYDEKEVFFWILNISFLISAMFNVGLMFVTCKNNFFNFLVIIRNMWRARGAPLMNNSGPSKSTYNKQLSKKYVIIVLILYFIVIILALFLDYINSLFGFLGSICSTLMMVILPCLFYLKLVPKTKPKDFYYFFSIFLIVLFIPLSIVSFQATFGIR